MCVCVCLFYVHMCVTRVYMYIYKRKRRGGVVGCLGWVVGGGIKGFCCFVGVLGSVGAG